ncbi:MAG: mechanosensitive ion channel [Lachnospiraceae bacterium]|nr:mechanosensitive ion channel [Lachnospiraceae bacterium]
MSALTKILSEAEAETTVIEQATENVEEKVDLLMQAWNAIWPGLLAFGKRLLVAIIIFVVGRIVIKALLKVSKRFFNKVNMETSVSKFLVSVIRILLYVVLIVMVCSQMGIATSSFIAILGSAGLAIGLALQGSLTNFAGGILILLVKPFKVGDYIVYAGGEEGTVSKIDIFYTNIITTDNRKIVIPNGSVANSTLTNVTAYDKRRVDLQIGISYSADISKAKEVITKVAEACDTVLKSEEIFVYVSNLDASQVSMGVRVWSKTEDYWATKFELTETIKNTLDDNNIEIPFNQLQVHVNKD